MPAPVAAAPAIKPLFKYVGGFVVKALSKQPKRTACWTVDPSAREAFRRGQVAKYKIDSTAAHVRDGLGWTDAELYDHFTLEMLADIHMDAYVPLCLEMEAGRHTEHPDTGLGLEIKTAADAEFERMVRHGEIEFTDRYGKTIRRLHVTPQAQRPPTLPDGTPGTIELDLGTPEDPPRAFAGMPVSVMLIGAGAILGFALLAKRG